MDRVLQPEQARPRDLRIAASLRLPPGWKYATPLRAEGPSDGETAFAAAEFLMDYLKTRAPFWKQEERDGTIGWVEAKDSDDAAAERWRKNPRCS